MKEYFLWSFLFHAKAQSSVRRKESLRLCIFFFASLPENNSQFVASLIKFFISRKGAEFSKGAKDLCGFVFLPGGFARNYSYYL